IPDSPNPDSLIPEEDQHNTQRAGEEFGVDPKQPTEMDLEWKPDEKLLKAYAKRIGIPVDLFTDEATATFVCHYSASGRFETQAAWVSLLVKWVKRDVATASNVRPFPLKRQVNGPDFNDTTWSDDLGAL
ncbi:MAG: DnaT-like ssDNA-binding domain-containing protein, partial [Stenotrophomonas sp.]